MTHLNLFTASLQKQLITKRSGEKKFGEHVQFLTNHTSIYEQLLKLDVGYVIFGISEDIGVRANMGKAGANENWIPFLTALLNMQSNEFSKPSKVLVLGDLQFKQESEEAAKLNPSKSADQKRLRELVSEIDKVVNKLVYEIVKAKKIPIAIGGGHNNAYGLLKGSSLAIKSGMNAINLDAHTDFRTAEGRHSGNGFSYAFNEGFLNKYFIFGLHENYTSETVFKTINKLSKRIQYSSFEDLFVRKSSKYRVALKQASDFVCKQAFGIEIDCDAISNIPSSAMTPSGFSVERTREWLHYFAGFSKVKYLHICEAAPVLGSKKTAHVVSKLLAYLVADFIKARGN